GPGAQQHRERGRPVHRVARAGAGVQDGPAGAAAAARRGPLHARVGLRHPGLPRRGAGQRRARAAHPALGRDRLGGEQRRDDLTTAGGSPLGASARTLLAVARNRDIRNLELAWTLGIGADWAILVVALLVAYDAG